MFIETMSSNNPVLDIGEEISHSENLVVNNNDKESTGDVFFPPEEHHSKQLLVKFDFQTRHIRNRRCKC